MQHASAEIVSSQQIQLLGAHDNFAEETECVQHLLCNIQLVLKLPGSCVQQGLRDAQGRLQLQPHTLAASSAGQEVKDVGLQRSKVGLVPVRV